MISTRSRAGCYAVLASLSGRYPPLEGRSPTCYSPVRHSVRIATNRVRLACVRHAASVDSEPGSNSHVKSAVTRHRPARPRTREQKAPLGNGLTRAPVDLALALFRTVFLSSDPRLLPLRASPGTAVHLRSLTRASADRLTLDGRPFPRWRERMHVASNSPIP